MQYKQELFIRGVPLSMVPYLPGHCELNDDEIMPIFTQLANVTDGRFFESPEETLDYLSALQKGRDDFVGKDIPWEKTADFFLSRKMNYAYLGFYVPITKIDPNNIYDYFYGAVITPGFYGGTIPRPIEFREYYLEQLSSLKQNHRCRFFVGVSDRSIQRRVLSENYNISFDKRTNLIPLFSQVGEFKDVDDDLIDGKFDYENAPIKPISFFSAARTNFSLEFLNHYCGSNFTNFQKFIIFVNYLGYAKHFFDYASRVLKTHDSGYTEFVGPEESQCSMPEQDLWDISKKYQMPAYHLKREHGMGISLVNIGVGASNAKTITDHLAILRPYFWIMVGHCAGLQRRVNLGDYVLPSGYVRRDFLMNDVFPLHFSIPILFNVQKVLEESIQESSSKARTHHGIVISSAQRTLEFQAKDMARFIHIGRMLAWDMEAATIATNGFRMRVPYAALLRCIDNTVSGILKTRKKCQDLYNNIYKEHLGVALVAIEKLRNMGIDQYDAKEIRGFREPPFR